MAHSFAGEHPQPAIPTAAGGPAGGYRAYVLTSLTSVYALNIADRQLVVISLESIKHDLHLSDTQLGFLTGIAFGVFYAILGVPIARWADRGNRAAITSFAIGLWGLTVMSCTFALNFPQLVAARIAGGVGEAGCKPPIYSLLGDYFPKATERVRAMTIYSLSSPLSSFLSLIVGGWMVARFGWRSTFLTFGFFGLAFSLLVGLTIRDTRRSAAGSARASLPTLPLSAVLATIWKRRSCRHICAALILVYALSLGLAPWYAAFLIRSHQMATAEVGLWLGLVFGLGGACGILLGGSIATRWFAGNEAGQMRMSALAMIALLPLFFGFLLAPSRWASLTALFLLMTAFHSFLGPIYALMQRLVGEGMRATMMAIVMLLANLVGFGVGPQLVGVLSDQLQPMLGAEALRYAMLSMSLLSLWAAFHFYRVGRWVKSDLREISELAGT